MEKSKIAQHCWSENHRMLWDEAHIIHREEHYLKRKLIEASYIKLADRPISQPSVEVRPLWLSILKKKLCNKKSKVSTSNIPIKESNAKIHIMVLWSRITQPPPLHLT